jgi:protocatechuate 3,4-dioxygenase beta subunit
MKNTYLLVFFISLLVSACGSKSQSGQPATTTNDSSGMQPVLQLVADSEPGDRMIISGTVYLPDGKTPAKGAILSLWQTDANGCYIAGGGGAGELHPRIHGRLMTGADGKYEIHTIKPGQYPSHTSPAHIHGHISAPDFPEYPIIYYFEGDDLITDKNRPELNSRHGGTPSIIMLTKDKDGVLIGHRDFILEYIKPSDETMKLQW